MNPNNHSTRTRTSSRHIVLASIGMLCIGALSSMLRRPAPPAGASIDPSGVRTVAPVGVALERAERRVADAYEVESADKSEAGRHKLVQTMLNDATQTHDDLAGRYVLLREARRLAFSLNDSATADYLTRQIDALYAIAGPGTASAGDAIPGAAHARPHARLPIPSETAGAAARKKLKAKYSDYYANSTALVRSSLLTKLLAEADAVSESADQYIALREAADIAITIGNLSAATQCNSTLAATYLVDEVDLRVAMLSAGAAHMGKEIPAHDLALADLDLAEDAVQADNFDAAARALTLAQVALPGAADEALTARYHKREKDIRDMRDEYQRVSAVIKKLPSAPNDKDLNLKAGRFYCLAVGDWNKGLPMLAKGSDIGMKLLAETESARPSTVDGQLKLADAWWDRSGAEAGTSAAHCKQRAGYWYRQAKTASPVALPDRVTTRLLTTSRSIDLMALMNATRDRVSGQWTGSALRLTCTNAGVSRLQFPHALPEEYDFAVQFTIHKAGDNVVQIIPMRDSYFVWSMGAGHTAFETIDPNAHPIYNKFTFVPNKVYLSVVEVRKTGVRASVNGAVVAEWKTNFDDFTPPPTWKLGDPHMLGFGSAFTEVMLQSAKLVDLSSE